MLRSERTAPRVAEAATYSMRLAIAGVLAAFVSACAVGPNYRAPDTPMPAKYAGAQDTTAEGAGDRAATEPADLSAWWHQFPDPELQSLIARGLESNLDLQTAASRIREARAQEVIAGARGLPNVNATGLGAYVHSNSNPLGALSGGSGGSGGGGSAGGTGNGGSGAGGDASSGSSSSSDGQTTKLFAAGFDATWELDLFGGIRRGIEAAHAAADAAVWQLRDGEVSLSAEIAVDYLTLCATRTRIRVTQEAIQRQRQQLDITDARRNFGFVTELDVNQQRAQLAVTTAQLPSLEAEARAMTHALAVLLGQPPEAIADELSRATEVPGAPPLLPVGLPSDLLRRRPDVRQAERRFAAATAQVGVAVAQLYPSFDLIGAANYASNSADHLITSRNFSSVGAGLIRWPLLTGGAGHAGVKAREEERQQAYLAYQKAVLRALQDAEDALVRFNAEQRRLTALLDAQTAASSSLDIARSQYRSGTVPFINVLNTEVTLLDVQNQLTQSRAALSQALVSVYKALGGGWHVDPDAQTKDERKD
jgi:NodT family efflux transporter outer membrane factor (OMF) lipoprotein